MEIMMYTTCSPQSANKPLRKKTTMYKMLFAIPSGQFQMICLTCSPTQSAPSTAPVISTQSMPLRNVFQSMLVGKEFIHRIDEHRRLVHERHVPALGKDHQL